MVDFVASGYTVTYFQTAVNGWERERRTFGSNISSFTPQPSRALKETTCAEFKEVSKKRHNLPQIICTR